MRTQGEARFTGRWQDRSTSTSIVLDSIAKQTEDEAILDNSLAKPEYSAGFSAIVGITLSLGVLIGTLIYLGVRHGW